LIVFHLNWSCCNSTISMSSLLCNGFFSLQFHDLQWTWVWYNLCVIVLTWDDTLTISIKRKHNETTTLEKFKKVARNYVTSQNLWDTPSTRCKGENLTPRFISWPFSKPISWKKVFDVKDYAKPFQAIWRRLKDVNLELFKEAVALMTLEELWSKGYFRELHQQKPLSRKSKAQFHYSNLTVNLTREDDRRCKRVSYRGTSSTKETPRLRALRWPTTLQCPE